MFLVGLTGGIATGKSTVSKLLQDLGVAVIDADVAAREVVQPGRPAWKAIRATFGAEFIKDDGTLNREKLGQVIFADPDKRRQLNAITHPQIYKWMVWQVIKYFVTGRQFVVLDLPLLFESATIVPYATYAVVVNCDSQTQIQRLRSRNNYSREEALQRINSQMSLAEKCRRATHVIENSGSREETGAQVDQLVNELKHSRAHWKVRSAVLLTVCGLLGLVAYLGSML